MGLDRAFPSFLDDGFYGRERELAELDARIGASDGSFLTILGPPGSGKTRLARELIARRVAADDRVLFCDLTACLRREDVIAALERTAGWEPGRGTDLHALDDELARADLVVLDNAEHVVEPLHELVASLRTARLLITSRIRIGTAREQLFELAYLPVDGDGEAPSPAHELFLERARRRNADFARRDSELSAVDEIVRALDGCPLALELAASRAGRASAELLRDQLSETGLGILTDRERCGGRFDSLCAALEGSLSLLDVDERRALLALSLLQGAWSLKAAAAILGLDGAATLDRVEALRDRSLVQMDPMASTRYRVYEIVREHALGSASAADRDEAYDRLSRHLVQPRWGAMAFVDHDEPPVDAANLHVVLDAELSRGRSSSALQALLRLRLFYLWRGPHAVYAELLQRVAALVPASEAPDGDDVLVRVAQLELDFWQGRFPQAAARTEAVLDEVRSRGGDACLEAYLLARLGNVQGALYAPERGTALLEEAQRALPHDAPAGLRAHVLQQLATFLVLHDADEAERRLEGALLLVRPLGQARHLVQVLALLAVCRLARGARESARDAIVEARGAGATDDERWLAMLDLLEGALRHEDGEPTAARGFYEAARDVFANNGNPWLAGLASLFLGDLCLEEGDDRCSERAYGRALQSLRPIGEQLTTAWALGGLGALRARQGRRAEAGRLFDEADAIADATPLPMLRRAVELRRLELSLDGGEAGLRDVAARVREAREIQHAAVRFPLRTLSARLEATWKRRATEALEVQRDGRWFQLGDGPRVDLSRRKRLAGILRQLARAPGWVPFDDLFEAVWPGESCVPGSDVNRMNVTVSRLRGTGLGDHVECDSGRFRISPALRIRLHD